MAEYIYFPVSGIQRPDGTWLDGSEVADELNRLADENDRLRRFEEAAKVAFDHIGNGDGEAAMHAIVEVVCGTASSPKGPA